MPKKNTTMFGYPLEFCSLVIQVTVVWAEINKNYRIQQEGTDKVGGIKNNIPAREKTEKAFEDSNIAIRGRLYPGSSSESAVSSRHSQEHIKKSILLEKTLKGLMREDYELQDSAEHIKPRSFVKRTIVTSIEKRWTGGVVPYLFTDKTTPANRHEIKRAMRTFERFTCMRFVPWTQMGGLTTNMIIGLDHPGYLNFTTSAGCWSFTGNLRSEYGQLISCCGGTTCVHELGHAMGESHEHQSPSPDRDRMIRINFDGIKPGYKSSYTQHSAEKFLTEGYDLSSYMHYSKWSFRLPGRNTFEKLFPELPNSNSHYYMMKEVSDHHDCHAWCPLPSKQDCENDGYLTLVDDRCSCRCIPGLDPTTGCTTILKTDPPGLAFPGGKYAIPAHSSGCPDENFFLGYLNNDDESIQHNFTSLAFGNKVNEKLCVRNDTENNVIWSGGNYCIYRKDGMCPGGFQGSFIQYKNHGMPNAQSGELPDGVHGEYTRLECCCKNSGFSKDELHFPSRKPLTLIKHPKNTCHQIRGMHVKQQNLRIGNTERNGTIETGGEDPVFRVEERSGAVWISFCHYQPATIDCGDVIYLDEANPEITISSPNATELECFWLIKAPPGERLQLDFNSFNIEGDLPRCKDRLEVRYVRPGQPGVVICGGTWDQSTISINNTIHLRLTTHNDSISHFNATVKLVQNSKLCYSVSDRGMTYDGDVNFTRTFKPCVPWHEVAHCKMHSFNYDTFNSILEDNKCRNPDQATGFMPWCYTNAETCSRDYCDVCLLGKTYDTRRDCDELKAKAQCPSSGCARTCRDHTQQPSIPVEASQVSCDAPDNVPDGTPVITGNVKNKYAVGEAVTYKCNEGDFTRKRFCMTSGQWSSMGTVCSECPRDYILNTENRQCYLYYNTALDYTGARVVCGEVGAFVAYPENLNENMYLGTFTTGPLWLGISDSMEEGKFRNAEGRSLSFTNWASSQPNNYRDSQDCAERKEDGEWNDIPCTSYNRRFICQKPATVIKQCLDFSNKCQALFAVAPSMCVKFSEFAARQCRFTCGLCRSAGSPSCTVVNNGEQREIFPGMTVFESCKEGYVRTSGDEVRGCTTLGTLTGKPLQCVTSCPSGWSLHSDNLHCYRKFKDKKIFPLAQAHCETYNGTLSTAQNKNEQDMVNSVRVSGDIWLGLMLVVRDTERKWVWIDRDLLTWANWNKNKPSKNRRAGRNCAVMKGNSKWNDVHCSRRVFSYVCKAPIFSFKQEIGGI